jgi:hypothetical protein
MRKRITWMLGWLMIMVVQAVAALIVVFLFSLVGYIDKVTNLGQFSLILTVMWLGFVIGVTGVGLATLRLRHTPALVVPQRLLFTAGIGVIPFLIIFMTAARVGTGNPSIFQNYVMAGWMPTLSQVGLIFAIIGFYIPSWLKKSA